MMQMRQVRLVPKRGVFVGEQQQLEGVGAMLGTDTGAAGTDTTFVAASTKIMQQMNIQQSYL
jgi:hypothetical protein